MRIRLGLIVAFLLVTVAPQVASAASRLRIPMAEAIPVYGWLRIGDIVDVYA
jgi:hypothetical protein